jgi:hypoxanthine-DNA glycosylase
MIFKNMLKGLNHKIKKDTKILILGSFPGEESLRKKQYYAHPSNDFWKLISNAINEDLTKLNYKNKIKKLHENKIGLWDVYKNCKRKGSEDSKIKCPVKNDFSKLKKTASKIRLICFNGKTSGSHEKDLKELGYKTKILPSSSGLNKRDVKTKTSEWASIVKYI